MELMPDLLAKSSVLMVRFQSVLGRLSKPLRDLFDMIANSISFLFQKSTILRAGLFLFELFIVSLEGLAYGLNVVTSSVAGFIEMIIKLIENLSEGKILGMFEGTGDAFSTGFDEMMRFQGQGQGQGALNTSNNVTNIGKVEIKNEFKENMQPDRIAFSLKEQLLKTAQNPTGARSRSFSRTGATGSF